MSLRWSPGGRDWVSFSALSESETERVYKYCRVGGWVGGWMRKGTSYGSLVACGLPLPTAREQKEGGGGPSFVTFLTINSAFPP